MFKKQEINDHIFPRLKKESYLHRRKLRDYVLRFSENVLPGKKVWISVVGTNRTQDFLVLNITLALMAL